MRLKIIRDIKYLSNGITLSLIILAGFLLRLSQLLNTKEFFIFDPNRDYLVANHISKYNELPLTGPASLIDSTLSSPLYYYILSVFLFINDSMNALGTINVILLSFNILLIYLIGKNLFNKRVGLLSAAIFSIGDIFIYQASFMWQPHLMQVLLSISYLLLTIYIKNQNPKIMGLSIITFICSLAIHNSVLVILPSIAIIYFLTIKKYEPQKMLTYSTLAIITTLALYISPITYYVSHGKALYQDQTIFELIKIASPSDFFNNILTSISLIFSNIFTRPDYPIMASVIVIIIAMAIITLYSRQTQQKIKTSSRENLILVSMISQTIILLSLIYTTYTIYEEIPIRYYTPILIVIIILIASLVNDVSRNLGKYDKIFFVLLSGLIIYATSGKSINLTQAITFPNKSKIDAEISSKMLIPIIDKIEQIKMENDLKNYLFFKFASYVNDREGTFQLDAALWNRLEKKLNTKFVKVDDGIIIDYSPLGTDNYIFLICLTHHDPEKASSCQKSFTLKEVHIITNHVYSGEGFDIFLAKK